MDERGEHSAETEKPVTKGPVRITALHEVTKGSFEASLLRTSPKPKKHMSFFGGCVSE